VIKHIVQNHATQYRDGCPGGDGTGDCKETHEKTYQSIEICSKRLGSKSFNVVIREAYEDKQPPRKGAIHPPFAREVPASAMRVLLHSTSPSVWEV